MIARSVRLVLFATALAALWLSATASAHQIVTVSGSELTVNGDVTKRTDEVTITYDSVKDEYVIGHDIEDPIPPGCYRDAVEPFHKLHCPAKGITKIVVNLGSDKDKYRQENILDVVPQAGRLGTVTVILPKELKTIEVNTGEGNDSYEEESLSPEEQDLIEGQEEEEAAAREEEEQGEAAIRLTMGLGVDKATLSRGSSVVDFDGSARLTTLGGFNQVTIGQGGSTLNLLHGINEITVGPGNSKATVSGGLNTVLFGPGTSTFSASGGTNSVTFGAGNSVFSGGSGADTALFGPGNNTFKGGPGEDVASMGPGRDHASGGPAHDILRGGPGRDSLRGEAGKDDLFGGPGGDLLIDGASFNRLFGGSGMDECLGPAHAILRGCEKP